MSTHPSEWTEPAFSAVSGTEPNGDAYPHAMNRTHRRLLEAATRLFAARGFHGTGIRDLATASNLGTASLYHYMGTKERLLHQIMNATLDRLLFAAQEIESRESEPGPRLAALVRMHVMTHALERDASVVVDNELDVLIGSDRAQIIALRDAYHGYWSRTLTAGVESGCFAVPDLHITRISLVEMCSGVARGYSPDGPKRLSAIADICVRLAGGLLTGGLRTAGLPEPAWTAPTVGADVVTLVEEVWRPHAWDAASQDRAATPPNEPSEDRP